MGRKVQLVSVIYLLAWLLCPPLQYGVLFRALALGSCAIWLLSQYLVAKKIRLSSGNLLWRYGTYYLIAMVAYILGDLAMQLIFSETDLGTIFYNNLQVYILLMIGFIGTQYVAEERWEDVKVAVIAIVLFCVVFSLTAIFRGEQYLAVTREAGGESKFSETVLREAASRGIGGFGFFCFTSILAPVLLYVVKTIKMGRKTKFATVIAMIICEIGVISAGYTLALLISVMGFTLLAFFTAKSGITRFICIALLVVVIFFGSQFMEAIYNLLLSISADSLYENKVKDIFSYLIDGESEGTFASRSDRYLLSFESIFKYPIFGSLFFDGKKVIGYHSSILDTVAAFGWGIGFCWIYVITIYHSQVMKHCGVKRGVRFSIVLLIFLTGLFNRLVMTVGALYFLLPFIAHYSKEGKANASIVDNVQYNGKRRAVFR